MASTTTDLTVEPSGQAEGYEAFKVEHRGIDLIPEQDKKMKPSDLFWLWAGAVWNVEFLVYGALIMSFAFSFWQAVAAILIGNLFFALLGLASLQGPVTGTTALMVSRAPFGRNGNRPVSLFNWITQVGFEIEGLYFVVELAKTMFQRGGVTAGRGLEIGIIVVALVIQIIVPFLGHATITKVLRYLSLVFIVLFALMAILVIPHAHLSAVHQHTSLALWTTGVVLIVSAGGLGWTENGNDYSRYLSRSTSKAKTFWADTLGAGIPAILLELLGAGAYLVSTKTALGVTGIPTAFTAWFFWPFAVLAIVQLFAINTMDLYSSGVTLQALGLRLSRVGCVVLDTIVSGAVTAYIVFNGHFYQDLSGFLDYIVVWLAPWFGIMMVDWLLRRGRYDPGSLVGVRGGLYWRTGGWNIRALVAQALGMVAAMMWIDAAFYQPAYTGPISSTLGGSDLSWVAGIVVGSLVYFLLSWKRVRWERERTPALD